MGGFIFPGNLGGYANFMVPIVMLAWLPTVIYLFSRLPARQAVVVSFLTAWMFLPEAELPLPGLPNYSKITATCYGILLATVIFDVERFKTFRFGWLDIPMAVWCVVPLLSSLSNNLGAYDGFSAVLARTVTWGGPYFLGRIYLSSLQGLRQLAVGMFVGGLIYAPLCIFESRMSPQLHRIIYGAFPHDDFSQTIRMGGYRPMVFMQHGLAVGAFMMAATLTGLWLWQTGTIKKMWNIPMGWLFAGLFLTFVLTRSTGAIVLFAIGLGMLLVAKHFRTALPVFVLIFGIGLYLYYNTQAGGYFSDQLVGGLSQIFPEDRVASLAFRLNNEELLVNRAQDHMLFGWGGWGRSRAINPETGRLTIQDSLWVLAFGENGIVGLISLFTAMLLPVAALFWLRYPARTWSNPKVAPAAVLALMLLLYVVDCILNAMVNPIYILACGGIAGLVMSPEKVRQNNRTIRTAPIGRYVSQR
jgi:hypothetical protein